MAEPIEILNGDDRPHALKTLKRAVKGARGASRKHLASVLRSLNPDAARSRAFKGDASMAKRTKKAAAHHRRRITRKGNPTSARQLATKAKERVRVVTRRAASNFKSLDLMGLLKEGAGIGVGMLASSFVEKQAEKFLPASLPASVKSALASAVVAGGAIAFGGANGFPRSIAAGAIGEAIRSIGRSYAPTMFAGTDGTDASAGYWDPTTGQWIPAGTALAGVAYDPAYPIPVMSERPDGM
jgi:hypothetical protein